MRTLVSVFLVIMASSAAFAQPDTLWTRMFGGDGYEFALGTIEADNGDFLVAGSSNSFTGNLVEYVLRLNTQGDTVWTYHHGVAPNANRQGMGIVEEADHSLSVLVSVQTGDNSYYQIVHLTQDGQFDAATTSETYDGIYPCCLKSGFEDQFVAGGGAGEKGGRSGFLHRRRWTGFSEHTYPLGYRTDIYGAAVNMVSSPVGWILGGSLQEEQTSEPSFLLIRTDSNGVALWSRTYGEGANVVSSVVTTDDGGFAFVGPTDSYGPGGDVILMKVNADGDSLWSRTYGGEEEDHAHRIMKTADGGFLLTGHSDSYGENGDVFLVRTDSVGNERWEYVYGGSGYDVIEAGQATTDGGYILAGTTFSFGADNGDILVMRFARDLASPEPTGGTALDFSLAQNYPNPFNAITRISFSLPQSSVVSLRIFDTLGREAAQVISDERLSAGNHEVSVDASPLPTGLYFYRLEAGGTALTRKMVVLK